MKKVNLVKKLVGTVLSCAMLTTVLPAVSFADGTDTTEEKGWKTVTNLDMSNMVSERADGIYSFAKTVNGVDYHVKNNSGKGPFVVQQETGTIKDWTQSTVRPMIDVNGLQFNLDRRWNNGWGSWQWADPESKVYTGNAIHDVAVGDKVKVTAWVYPTEPAKWQGATINDGATDKKIEGTATEFNYRMWLIKEWSPEDPGYATTEPGAEYGSGKVKADAWNEISFEYTVTDSNINYTDIAIDNGAVSLNEEYPLHLYFAGMKVQKEVPIEEADSTVPKTTITNLDMSNLEVNDTGTGGFTATKTVGGNTYTISTLVTPLNGCGDWANNPNSGVVTDDEDGFTTAFLSRHTFENWHDCGAYSGERIWGHPLSSETALTISNVFTADQVKVGDKIRVTATVKAYDMKDTSGHDEKDTDVTTANFRVYMYQPGAPWYNSQAENLDISYNEVLSANEWHDITFEYIVTNENACATSMRFDNKTDSTIYPLAYKLKSVKVEKDVVSGTYSVDTSTNTVSGTANVYDSSLNGADILVAAYNGQTFLGLAKATVSAGTTVDYSINASQAADRVVAYIWKAGTIEPLMVSVPLRKV